MRTSMTIRLGLLAVLVAVSPAAGSVKVFSGHDVTGGFVYPSQVRAVDFNGDGYADLLVTGWEPGASGTVWLENDGAGNFASHAVTDAGFATHMTAVGMDLDADLDLVAGTGSAGWGFTWWENGGAPFVRHDVDPPAGDYEFDSWDVRAADVDGDGDPDVVAAGGAYAAGSPRSFCWWENEGATWERHIVTGTYTGSKSVAVFDLDKDGDQDVVLCFFGSGASANALVWWENGPGTTFTEHRIGDILQADDPFPVDLDGDGDVDLLTADGFGLGFTWWENGGAMDFTPRTIKGGAVVTTCVGAADLDGDGDLDIYGADQGNKQVLWFENDGSQVFTERPVEDDPLVSVHVVDAADLDGDGDADLAGVSTTPGAILWWENELPANTSFEAGPKIPASWRGKKLALADGRNTASLHSGLYSFRFVGSPAAKSLSQTLLVSGKAGDSLTLGGWSRSRGTLATGGVYSLEAKVVHADGTAKAYKALFTKGSHPWQYRQRTFAPAKDFNRIVVTLRYANQAGRAWFDDIVLKLN